MSKSQWTDELKEKLKREYGPYGSAPKFSHETGISLHAVYKMANVLGLKQMPKGTYIMNTGYLCYRKMQNGKTETYLVHRKLMEEHIGRKLNPNEVVHHINGDKIDNRIDNLIIMTRSEHIDHHRD